MGLAHDSSILHDSRNAAPQGPTHDAAGNLTYDGVHQYAYDAWNRLVKVTNAYRQATDDGSGSVTQGLIQTGSTVAVTQYEGLGRRIEKQVENSADLIGMTRSREVPPRETC